MRNLDNKKNKNYEWVFSDTSEKKFVRIHVK